VPSLSTFEQKPEIWVKHMDEVKLQHTCDLAVYPSRRERPVADAPGPGSEFMGRRSNCRTEWARTTVMVFMKAKSWVSIDPTFFASLQPFASGRKESKGGTTNVLHSSPVTIFLVLLSFVSVADERTLNHVS
jgi:hypothetical protein